MSEKATVDVLVTLKIFDNVAASALYALRDRLGYSRIQSLHRSDYWSLVLHDLDGDRALEAVERVVSKTALFANPNKHRWSTHVNVSLEDLVPREEGTTVAAVLVEDEDDAKAAGVRDALSQRGDLGQMIDVRHGTWWVLHFDGLSREDTLAAVNEIAVTKGRRQGLFCNPHYQRATVLVPERP